MPQFRLDSSTMKLELFLLELKLMGPKCMHCKLIFWLSSI